jgi:O-antigen/teichoic acid export membrane protein
MSSGNNYYLSSFFWSTVSKLLNAVLGFITVPLLLGYFGKADYGVIAIATAWNAYMHLLDLGMNTGAVKFFSQWAAKGDKAKINRVARTNITFYMFVALVNSVFLLALAFWGEFLFSVSHEEFLQLRLCFFILALFTIISWGATSFNQLLIADKQLDFTMKVQTIQTILKMALIFITIKGGMMLTQYFFWLTLIIALAIIPYAWKCRRDNLIDSIRPAMYWSEFKTVLVFSLSLFALSLFQVTASQSRPILLSIFSENGADAVADFKVVEVIPAFIITLCGSFTSIFLPKTSEMIVRNDHEEIMTFLKKWTSITTIIVCVLCFPFILSHSTIITAYVGESLSHLGRWMALWCVFLILQLHSTPAFSLIVANGKTKALVCATGISCLISMIINVALCKIVPVGSAVIGYCVYMTIMILVYYIYIYKRYLNLDRWDLVKSFIKPLILAAIACIIPYLIHLDVSLFDSLNLAPRWSNVLLFSVNSAIWLLCFFVLLKLFGLFPSIKPIRQNE